MSYKYKDYLNHPKWRRIREILIRNSDYKCSKCGKQTRDLDIHHKYYEIGKKPWEYPLSNYEVLCSQCHSLHHGKEPKYCSKCGIEIEPKFDLCFSCKQQRDREIDKKINNIDSELKSLEKRLNSFSTNDLREDLKRRLDFIQTEVLKTQQKIKDNNDIEKLSKELNDLKKEITSHLNNLNKKNKITESHEAYVTKEPKSKINIILLVSLFAAVLLISISAIHYSRNKNIKHQELFLTSLQSKFNRKYFITDVVFIDNIKLLKVNYLFADRGTIYLMAQYCHSFNSNGKIKLSESAISHIKNKFKERLFIVVGTGPNPAIPESIFVIPIREFSSNNLSLDEINRYKRKSALANFYYDIESDMLK